MPQDTPYHPFVHGSPLIHSLALIHFPAPPPVDQYSADSAEKSELQSAVSDGVAVVGRNVVGRGVGRKVDDVAS